MQQQDSTPPLSCGRAIMLAMALASPGVAAQDDPLTYSGHIELGGEYNSNLNISELERSTGKSDVGLLADAGISAVWHPTERWNVEGGYSFIGSRYDEVDTMDMDLHMLHADASYDFNLLTVGGNYYTADASLDGAGFLRLDQYSLYSGALIGERWYLRGSLNAVDKTFDTLLERDADTDGFSLDAFMFFNGGMTSLSFGYDHENEDARADRFDYDGETLSTRFSHRLTLLDRDARIRMGYRREERDYDSITPSIGVRRDDTRSVADAEMTLSWQRHFDLVGTIERGHYDSNLPSADYDETRITLSARLAF